MKDFFSHIALDDRHFTKSNLDGLYLKTYYQECHYYMHIYLTNYPHSSSIKILTAHDNSEKSTIIDPNSKDHLHTDRKSVGSFLILLALKLKYDLLNGSAVDHAGFLHSEEITKLHDKGITRVPTTIYRGIKKLIHKSVNSEHSSEKTFISKFLFEPYQLWHLVNYYGRIGADKSTEDTLWWLNIPSDNIYIYDTNKTKITDDDTLRSILKKYFPNNCLLTREKAKKFYNQYIEESILADDKHIGRNNVEIVREYSSNSHVVSQSGQGDYSKISEAIKNASPGDKIIVKPGHYIEVVIVDKPLKIIGEGKRKDIVVSFDNYSVALLRASKGMLSNITFKQLGEKVMTSCVSIRAGGCEVDSCDISCAGSDGVGVCGNSEPSIQRCHIHHCLAGIAVSESSKPVIENSKICNTKYSGITITGASDPTIQKNRIYDSMQGGIYIYGRGMGNILYNMIHNNTYSGIAVKEGGKPLIKSNRIANNGIFGIEIFSGGGGVIGDNDIYDNRVDDINISPDSIPFVEYIKD